MKNINIFYTCINKLPPQNILIEEVVLSNLLVDDTSAYQIMTSVNSDIFVLESHQIIYKNIIEIYKKYNYFSLVQFIYLLWNKKVLQKIGGMPRLKYLIQLSQYCNAYLFQNSFFYIKECINLLNSYYVKRLIIQYAHNIIYLSYASSISIKLLQQKTIKYFEELNNLIDRKENTGFRVLIGKFLTSIESKKKYKNINKTKILSGFQEFDNITSGLNKGDLIVIAGRPSTGKTSLAVNIAKYVICELSIGVYIFSLEMSKIQILYKLISSTSKVSTKTILDGHLTEREWINIQSICKVFNTSLLYIDDEPNISTDYIGSQIKSVIQKHGNNYLVIIDYLQLVQYNEDNQNTRTLELTYITRQIKLIARKYELPIIVLSQLNRNIENRVNKRPLLSDLRESGCISISHITNQCAQYKIISIVDQKRFYIVSLNFSGKYFFNYTFCLVQFKKFFSLKKPIYNLIIYNSLGLQITSNHRVFIKCKWKRKDQIKKEDFLFKYEKNCFCINEYICETKKIVSIKLFDKNLIYDVENIEYSNFTNNNLILHNSIEQDADLVLMIYQDQVINNNSKESLLDITVSKNRNGPIGSFQLFFNGYISTFTSVNRKI